MTELIVIIGPSGAGKSALARALHDRGAVTLWPTWTTRPPRPGEAGSVDHVFVSPEVFADQERRGAFVATACLPGLDHRYGLPRPVTDRRRPPPAVIARAEQVSLLRGLAKNVTAVAVTADRDAVAARLAVRDLPAAEQEARLAAHDAETAACRRVADHVVDNRSTIADLACRVAPLVSPPPVPTALVPDGRWWVRQEEVPKWAREMSTGRKVGVAVASLVTAGVATVILAYVVYAIVFALAVFTGSLNFGGSNK